MKKQVKNIFKIGDTIRSTSPYFGEPAYRLVGEDKYGFFGVWTGSKYGPPENQNATCLHHIFWCGFEMEESTDMAYKKCSLITRIYLSVLGNTYGRLKQYLTTP